MDALEDAESEDPHLHDLALETIDTHSHIVPIQERKLALGADKEVMLISDVDIQFLGEVRMFVQ